VQARKGFHGVNGKLGAKRHKFIHSFLPISAQGLPAVNVEGLPAGSVEGLPAVIFWRDVFGKNLHLWGIMLATFFLVDYSANEVYTGHVHIRKKES